MNITTSFGQPLEVAETPNGLSVSRRNLKLSIDGSIWYETWYRNNKLHRDGKPAEFWYHEDGSIHQEEWYRDGKLHRDNGPAWISYYIGEVFPGDTRTFEELEEDGAVADAEWYLEGAVFPRFT